MKSNSTYLHLINGFVYDKLSNQDPSYSGLSIVAYKKALNMDPNNWRASLSIGRYYLKEHEYKKAISSFAKTLVINDSNIEALYGMANAAYATGNITLARNSLEKLVKLLPDDLQVYRIAALIHAAENNVVKANIYANKFTNCSDDLYEVRYLRDRLKDWQKAHKRNKFTDPIQETSKLSKNSNVTIECVILSFDETGSFSKGNNFLETLQEFKKDEFAKGLSVRLGNSKINDAYKISDSVYKSISEKHKILDNSNKWINTENNLKSVTKGFTIGFDSIRYNLNILNSTNSVIDIISRPIIQVAPNGGRGSFESGDKSYINTSGDVGSSLSHIPSGVKLEVESKQSDANNVMLALILEINKTVFKNSSAASKDIANIIHATLNTQIKVKLNETIVIGGVYSNVNESSQSGVPGFKDMPMMNLVLANKNTHASKKSVMMLLTVKDSNEKKIIETDIDNIYNILLLKEHEPSFFKNKYHKENQLKNQMHVYRREDVKLFGSRLDADIELFTERIAKS